MRLEKLGVRFKTVEEANAFKDVIEKVKATMSKCKFVFFVSGAGLENNVIRLIFSSQL